MVQKQGTEWRVRCAEGEVTAQHVVHCVSSLDRTIHKASGRAVLPVATYVAVTEPLTQDGVRTQRCGGRYAPGRQLLPAD